MKDKLYTLGWDVVRGGKEFDLNRPFKLGEKESSTKEK